MKRVAAYIRVSTDKQSTDSQLVAIKDAIQRSGDVLVQVYEDHAISGSKCRQDRPALDSMLKDAGAGKFDKVSAFDITRLGRSLPDLIATLNELQKSNVDLQFLQNDLDTSTAGGRMLFSIFGAIGEFERSLIRERVKAGLDKAVRSGKKLGRPSNLNTSTKTAVLELKNRGMGVKAICRTLQIGCGSYYGITKEAERLVA
jgi:DNA invertase Pin-like site-specific DNA recombinase